MKDSIATKALYFEIKVTKENGIQGFIAFSSEIYKSFN
jgi:hypothetical protein